MKPPESTAGQHPATGPSPTSSWLTQVFRPNSIRRLTAISAPVLAGFALATVTLLLTSPTGSPNDQLGPLPLKEWALYAFAFATALLLCSVQLGQMVRKKSRRTIYVAGTAYVAGILLLLFGLGLLLWPGAIEGASRRVIVISVVGAIVILVPVGAVVAERRPWRSD